MKQSGLKIPTYTLLPFRIALALTAAYEVHPRKDHRGVDLLSIATPHRRVVSFQSATVWLCLSQRHSHCVSHRQDCSDYDYSKGYKLDQIIWPLSVGISISEETPNACAFRCRGFHDCNTPFILRFVLIVDEVS